MAIFLPNPASLLPSAEVAVNPVPQGNYNDIALALGDSMAKIRETLQRKKELDALKKETENIATYVEDKSPQLSQYLRGKANAYDLSTTDINQERSGLLKGAIDLSRLEQGDRKIAASDQAVKLENTWKNKLSANNKALEIYTRDEQKWEAEQNDLFMRNEATRAQLAKIGKTAAPYVKVPYPKSSELRRIEGENVRLMGQGPEAIMDEQIPSEYKSKGSSFYSGVPVEEPDLPSGYTGPSDEPSGLLLPGPMDRNQVPDLVPGDIVPPPKAVPIPEVVSETPPDLSIPTPATPSIPINPSIAPVNPDSMDLMAAERREEIQQSMLTAQDTVDQIIDRAINIKQYFDAPELIDNIAKRRDEIKKQIANIPNAGSATWERLVRNILSNLSKDIDSIPKRTAIQEEKQQIEANKSTQTYYMDEDASKTPLEITKRQVNGEDVFTATDKFGKTISYRYNPKTQKLETLSGLTLSPVPTNGKVDVTAPGKLSAKQTLDKLRATTAQ